jgi:hypothetical protein
MNVAHVSLCRGSKGKHTSPPPEIITDYERFGSTVQYCAVLCDTEIPCFVADEKGYHFIKYQKSGTLITCRWQEVRRRQNIQLVMP